MKPLLRQIYDNFSGFTLCAGKFCEDNDIKVFKVLKDFKAVKEDCKKIGFGTRISYKIL
mgnify:CR=1 FL=1